MDHPTTTLTPIYASRRIEDIAFAEVTNFKGEQETLRLDIYQPVGAPAGPRPGILWFHGGGFRYGNDKRQVYIPRFAQAFAARGFVGIAPDYRIRPEENQDYPGMIDDAVADGRLALAWVRAHADEYEIDPQRLVLAGGSAGSILVLHLVHTAAGRLPGVQGVLDLWGSPQEKWRTFEHVRPDSPPTFIVHGTADQLLPYWYTQKFAAELEQAGVRCTLLTIPDAPHTPLDHFDEIVEAAAAFLQTLS